MVYGLPTSESSDSEEGSVRVTESSGVSVHNAEDPASAAMKLWRPSLMTHDDAWLPDRDSLVAKSDDAIRNNPMLQAGIRSQIDQVVGDHYRMSYEVKPEHLLELGMSAQQAERFIDSVEETFDIDSRSLDCWFDVSGRMTLSELVSCAMYTHYRQGEVIQLGHYRQSQVKNGNRPFATSVQMINPDRVITPFTKIDDELLRAGFRHNKYGYAYGMYVLNRHPNEVYSYGFGNGFDEFEYITRKTPWGRDKWQHIRFVEAADQTRGRSQLVSGLRKERMLSKFEDAMLSNAITRAFYAAVVESDDPTAAFEGMALQERPSPEDAAIEAMAARDAYYGGDNHLTLNGAAIAHMYKGDHLKLLTPEGQVDFMDPFTSVFLRYLSRTLDVSYEELSGDYSKTNYSGARSGELKSTAGRRAMAARVPEKSARFMATNWLEESVASGRIEFPGRTSRQRLSRFLLFKDRLCQFQFHGPGQGHIDPSKGTESAINELKIGAMTLKEYGATYKNKGWRELIRQRADEKTYAKSMGIDLNELIGVGQPPAQQAAVPQQEKSNND